MRKYQIVRFMCNGEVVYQQNGLTEKEARLWCAEHYPDRPRVFVDLWQKEKKQRRNFRRTFITCCHSLALGKRGPVYPDFKVPPSSFVEPIVLLVQRLRDRELPNRDGNKAPKNMKGFFKLYGVDVNRMYPPA